VPASWRFRGNPVTFPQLRFVLRGDEHVDDIVVAEETPTSSS
jgi:hypothetical protein